jgi:hypothetical protein
VFHASYAAGAQSVAIHDEGIELDLALAVQKAPATGIEGLVIFHHHYGCLDRVERRTAALEDAPARVNGAPHAIKVSFDHVIRNRPRAAVDNKDGIVAQGSLRKLVSVAL